MQHLIVFRNKLPLLRVADVKSGLNNGEVSPHIVCSWRRTPSLLCLPTSLSPTAQSKVASELRNLISWYFNQVIFEHPDQPLNQFTWDCWLSLVHPLCKPQAAEVDPTLWITWCRKKFPWNKYGHCYKGKNSAQMMSCVRCSCSHA